MPKKILIVDDEPLIVKGLKYSLESDGYETDSAQDGEEAFFEGFHCAPTYLRAAAMLIELSHGRQGVLYGYPST